MKMDLIVVKCAECGGILSCELEMSTQTIKTNCSECLFTTDCNVKKSASLFKIYNCVCVECEVTYGS